MPFFINFLSDTQAYNQKSENEEKSFTGSSTYVES